jgi:hypothetical protein
MKGACCKSWADWFLRNIMGQSREMHSMASGHPEHDWHTWESNWRSHYRTEHNHSYVGYMYITPFSTNLFCTWLDGFSAITQSPTVICEDKIALIRPCIILLTITWLLYDYHHMSVQHSQQFFDECCALKINKTLLKKSLTPELIYLYMPQITWGQKYRGTFHIIYI